MQTDFDIITIKLFQYMSSVFVFIYFFSKSKGFRNIMNKVQTTFGQKMILIIIFGLISIMGTYLGFPVKNAIANTRAIGIIVAGLIGGPFVGVAVGAVSGLHRYFLGGLTINAAIISAIIQGYISGIFYHRLKHKKNILVEGLLIGVLLELIHMIIIIMVSRPLADAILTVKQIGPPMVIINSLGVMLLLAILQNVRDDQEKMEGHAAETALEIANKTLPYMKKGLNEQSAKSVAEIVYDMGGDFDTVIITSREHVLAYVQNNSRYSLHTDNSIFSENVIHSLDTGKIMSFSFDEENNRDHLCRIIIPLKIEDRAVGTMILSKNSEKMLTHYEIKLAKGIAQLISTQLEISKGQYQSYLVAQAEIRALQAQINPHFLFNSLNTIVYYCIADPITAKNLIIHLADFYRKNIVNMKKMVELKTEIQHIKSYMVIESARFEGKVDIIYEIDPECNCLVPPLILQPIVENSIRHGVLPKLGEGTIKIKTLKNGTQAILTIEDDGVGMSAERLELAFGNKTETKNIGLRNVKSRIKNIYGDESQFTIESEPDEGTKVTIVVPMNHKEKTYEDHYR
jgi:two-component system sensor histidine kinase LytS